MDTADLTSLVGPDKPLYGIEVTNDGLVTFPGGVAIVRNEKVVGAIGVSGDVVENDHAVATAGSCNN